MAAKAKTKAVGAKIRKLVGEGVPQKQAVAEGLAMWRAGRLTTTGKYLRKGKT